MNTKEAFSRLSIALRFNKLPCTVGERWVDPSEFMLMQVTDTYYQFKHVVTRNYLFVTVTGPLKAVVPTGAPFCQGIFDADH